MKQISVLHQYYNKITFPPIFSIENIVCLDQSNKHKSEWPDFIKVIND